MRYIMMRRAAESFPVSQSIDFVESASPTYDRAVISTLPTGFGSGEFTLELFIRCLSNGTYALGDTTSGGLAQRRNWSNSNPTRYGAADWWFAGNFLLDGHQNSSFSAGTFSLQVANGRIRWTFGDGAAAAANTGSLWGIQGATGTSVLDNAWHRVACVRRWNGASNADLELWVDGTLEDTQTTTSRTNMATTYWNSWTGYPANQGNWMFGTEKQAYLQTGGITQYEDFKGQLGEVRFWNVARTSGELATPFAKVQNNASGLEAVYRFSEQTGSTVARQGNSGGDMTLNNGVTWNTATPFS